MANYRMPGAPEEWDEKLLLATHPAPVGTYIVYALKNGGRPKSPVVLWGVQQDGTPVPITLSGAWDGCDEGNANAFVLHPDGRCSTFDHSWDNIDLACEEMKERERA